MGWRDDARGEKEGTQGKGRRDGGVVREEGWRAGVLECNFGKVLKEISDVSETGDTHIHTYTHTHTHTQTHTEEEMHFT